MFLRTVTLATSLLLSASYAHALEGKALLDQFVAAASANGSNISWDYLNQDDDSSFTMTGVTIEGKTNEKITMQNVVVRGLRERGGRISYDSISIGNIKGKPKDGGAFAVNGIATTAGDLPLDIWEDGLTAQEKRERITFGNFTVNGIAVSNEGVDVALDAVVMTNADIPLDFRFDPDQLKDSEGEPAAPATFDQFAVTGLTGNQQGVAFEMTSLSVADASFPTTINAPVEAWMKLYSAMSFNGIKASMADTPVFALDTLSGTITPADSEGTFTTVSQMSGLMINLLAIPDPQAKAVAQQLGYEKIEGSMTGIGTFNPTTGRMVLRDTVMKLKDMFDLSLDYAITGYTREVAQKFNQAQAEIALGKDQMQAYGAIMGDLGGVKLETFKISLTDQSLTGKLLDFQAQQMGTTGDQLAAGAPMMIGLGMGGLQMPALTEMVTAAVGKFLTEKGTLNVEAVPSEPVSILNIVLAGQSDPTKIPEMLNLNISAE